MATLNEVKVKGDKFEPASQNGRNGDTVPFKNKRSESVTVSLDASYFRPSTLNLQPDGQSGSSGNVTIIGTSGTAPFKAPKQPGTAQTDNDIKGDILINPSK